MKRENTYEAKISELFNKKDDIVKVGQPSSPPRPCGKKYQARN